MHRLVELENVVITDTHVAMYYSHAGIVQITSPQEGMFHVAYLRMTDWSAEVYIPSTSIVHYGQFALAVKEESDRLVITLPTGKAIVHKEPFGIEFATLNGEIIAHSPAGIAYLYDGWRVRTTFSFTDDERVYGLGQSDIDQETIDLDHRGTLRPLWNKHLPAPSRLLLPVLYSSRGYGLFFDNSWTARFDFGIEQEGQWFYEADGGVMNYYFFFGQSLSALLDQYTTLTGRPELPPLWSFGFVQSKYGYRTREEVEELAVAFRTKGIPCDGIILDLYWFRHMGDLVFDEDAFPQPAQMIASLQRDGFQTIAIEEPYVTKNSRLFAEGESKGYFGKRGDGTTYTFPFWPGESALVDFTNPDAKEWWGRQHIPLMELGLAGWWTDLNEPEVHPADMVHHTGVATEVHNRYALGMHEAIAQAHASHQPEKRLWMMSRAAWAGSQRYGVGVWSGDVDTTWEHLQKQMALGISMGLAGLPLWNTDIGGFKGELPTAELYVRWVQFGAFTPTMRPHGNQQEREPWAFGSEAEAIVKKYIEWRYRLLPYVYKTAYDAYTTGLPYMRPTFIDTFTTTDDVDATDQYMFGDALLVAPVVVAAATSRAVVLPTGNWYDFWSGERVEGNRTITVTAPLDVLPLFVRAGSIIPLLPVMQHTGQRQWTELTFRLYPATSGDFTLYEDDGVSTAYKDGAFCTTKIEQHITGDRWHVHIAAGNGSFTNMPTSREVTLAFYDVLHVQNVRVDGTPMSSYEMEGTTLRVSLGSRSTTIACHIEVNGTFGV